MIGTIKEVCGKKEWTNGNPWFTADCQTMIDKREVVKLKWLATKIADDKEGKQRLVEQLKKDHHETNLSTKLLLRRCK